MKKENSIALAIYLNSRGFGYACLEDPHTPIDYGVVTIQPISHTRILKRIQSLVSYLSPSIVVIQHSGGKYGWRSERIQQLSSTIKGYVQSIGLDVSEYTREQIRDVFEVHCATNKNEIAQAIIREIPEIRDYAPRVRGWWMSEDYNMVMFDAFSLALTHYYLKE